MFSHIPAIATLNGNDSKIVPIQTLGQISRKTFKAI